MRAVLLFCVRVYRSMLSPLLPPRCRFHPTCSAFAAQAIEQYGAWRGLWLAFVRFLHCQPWGGCGYFPVPARFVWWPKPILPNPPTVHTSTPD